MTFDWFESSLLLVMLPSCQNLNQHFTEQIPETLFLIDSELIVGDYMNDTIMRIVGRSTKLARPTLRVDHAVEGSQN